MVLWLTLGAVATFATLLMAVSLAVIAYERFSALHEEASVETAKKLEAYEEIMEAIVTLNRVAVEIGEDRFHLEADKLLMDKDTRLEEPHSDVAATYERYYFLLDEDVYEAADDYVDYLVTYHEDGAKVADLLRLAGDVGAAMRSELGKAPMGGRKMTYERDRPE